MDTAVNDHHRLLASLTTHPASWSGADRIAALAQIERLRQWLTARESLLLATAHTERDDVNHGARDITQLSQQTAGVSFGEAKRRATRATWLPRLDPAAQALTEGRLGIGQTDELCRLAERLSGEKLPALLSAAEELVTELEAMTPAQTRKRLLEFERSLDEDDGTTRLERQRRGNRLGFSSQSDGTTAFHGSLDPVSTARLRGCIDAKVNELWRNRQGITDTTVAPPRDVLSNEKLRAEALVELVRAGHAAGAGHRGHAEVLVLIDYQTLRGELTASGVARLADGTPVPPDTIRQLACDANILPIVMGGASMPLDVGRASRLATVGQRAALRATHDTCCVDGCDVPFDYCDIHHIDWWRNGGRSDLANLVPVCANHHHLIHHHRWRLAVSRDRVGTLAEPAHFRRPSGTRRAASTEAEATRPRAGSTARRAGPGPSAAPSNHRVEKQAPRPSAPPPDAHAAPMRC